MKSLIVSALSVLSFVFAQPAWTWTRITDSAPCLPRACYTAVVFHDTLLVIGGWGRAYAFNDVWGSSDGQNWRRLIDSAPWRERGFHIAVVFHDTILVIGGWAPGESSAPYFNDVWCSTNGRDWRRLIDSAPWSPRCCQTIVVFHDTLWMIGGIGPGQPPVELTDVWYSPNGRDWYLVTTAVPFGPRVCHTTVVFHDTLWVIGGDTSSSRISVWCSHDGRHWLCVTDSVPWLRRVGHTTVVFHNILLVIGGWGTFYAFNDVWGSYDGRDWQCLTDSAPWRERGFHIAVVFHDTLFLMGGWDDWGWVFSDIWYTTGLGIEEGKFVFQPSRQTTTIIRSISQLQLEQPSVLLDASGRQVAVLKPGANHISHLVPGVYFISSDGQRTQKLILTTR